MPERVSLGHWAIVRVGLFKLFYSALTGLYVNAPFSTQGSAALHPVLAYVALNRAGLVHCWLSLLINRFSPDQLSHDYGFGADEDEWE